MLTGRVPFTAETPVAISLKHIQIEPIPPRAINSEIPEGVEEIILKAMAKDPTERYQEAQALSAAYWQALQPEPICSNANGAAPSSTLEVDSKPSSENAQKNAASSATIKVLPEKERELMQRHLTPMLFPLLEKSQPSQPSPASNPSILRKRHRPGAIALSCLLALMLLITLGLAWTIQPASPGNLKHRTQSLNTQQEVTNLTATAQAQLQVQATMAAQSRVQATAGITSSIGAGKVLYGDTLTNPDADPSTDTTGGWVDDGLQCSFKADGYHVQTYSPHTAAWCYSNQQQFSDVVITAQAQLLRGEIYGLVFRLSPVKREFYVLELNSLGEYRFVRATGTDPSQWLTLIDWTHSNAILSGYRHVNTFLIVAKGSQFRFYINQQLIVTNFSDSLYSSGLIGFLVGGDSAGGSEAVFSNVWVFQK